MKILPVMYKPRYIPAELRAELNNLVQKMNNRTIYYQDGDYFSSRIFSGCEVLLEKKYALGRVLDNRWLKKPVNDANEGSAIVDYENRIYNIDLKTGEIKGSRPVFDRLFGGAKKAVKEIRTIIGVSSEYIDNPCIVKQEWINVSGQATNKNSIK